MQSPKRVHTSLVALIDLHISADFPPAVCYDIIKILPQYLLLGTTCSQLPKMKYWNLPSSEGQMQL